MDLIFANTQTNIKSNILSKAGFILSGSFSIGWLKMVQTILSNDGILISYFPMEEVLGIRKIFEQNCIFLRPNFLNWKLKSLILN